jgi:hypothetical protein
VVLLLLWDFSVPADGVCLLFLPPPIIHEPWGGGRGCPEHAARLFGAAAALRVAIGAPLPPSEHATYDRAVATARSVLGDAAFDIASAAGQSMTLEQATALALDE